MDFPEYMVLNPLHTDFKYIPKKVKVLGKNPYTSNKVAWTPCTKCIAVGEKYCKILGYTPNTFKSVHPKTKCIHINYYSTPIVLHT